jgi:RHS repeat-associated protein
MELIISWVFLLHIRNHTASNGQRLTEINGNVTATIELDPWGGETNRSVNSYFQPRKFTTYDRDSNAWDEAQARQYSGWWSRFAQPDPYDGSYDMSDPRSFNRYAYVQNDPVNFVDPSGLMMSDCGAEWSFAQCGGAGGFWGGGSGFGGNVAAYNHDYGGLPPNIASAMSAHDQGVRDAIHDAGVATAVRAALANNNFALAEALVNANPNVGLSINGVQLFGELAGAFINGYGNGFAQLQLAASGRGVAGIAGRLASMGWKALADKLSKIRGPDFKLLNVNLIAGTTRFIARGDDMSTALQGVSAGGDAQASFAVGWMLQRNTPSPREIREWGRGLSFSSDFFFIGGGGVILSASQPSTQGVYVGVGAGGGVGASFNYPVR